MALLQFKYRSIFESLQGKSYFPPGVRTGLAEALNSIDEADFATALRQPEHSKENPDSLILERLQSRLPSGFTVVIKGHVSLDTRHENDFAIEGPDCSITVEIEKGSRARIDLDIRKMEAFARESSKPAFGVFVVPFNNRVDRSISGNTRESSFDYVCRTLRLSAHRSSEKTVPAVSAQERIAEALDVLKQGLEPFIDREMRKAHGDDWKTVIRKGEPEQKSRTTSDVYALLKILLTYWNEVFKGVISQTERSLTYELLDVRNQWAHQAPLSIDDAYRALDSAGRLLISIHSTEQASKLAQQKKILLRLLSNDETHRQLGDVLVIGYLDPTVHDDISTRAAPTPRKTAATSGIVDGTEKLNFEEVTKILGAHPGDFARALSSLRELREILRRRVPALTEKVNPKGSYIGYRGDNSDRAYVYVQPNLLVIDLRQPRTIEPLLSKTGVEILHRNNYQGRAGWTTGIHLSHNASSLQVEMIADQIIQALTE